MRVSHFPLCVHYETFTRRLSLRAFFWNLHSAVVCWHDETNYTTSCSGIVSECPTWFKVSRTSISTTLGKSLHKNSAFWVLQTFALEMRTYGRTGRRDLAACLFAVPKTLFQLYISKLALTCERIVEEYGVHKDKVHHAGTPAGVSVVDTRALSHCGR